MKLILKTTGLSVIFIVVLLFNSTIFSKFDFEEDFLREEPLIIIPRHSACLPKINIVFSKTHKTASTTVQNIFFRFVEKHHLVLAMPTISYQLYLLEKFDQSVLFDLKPGYNYNVFTHHMTFNYAAMRAAMPNDAKFVTILRDPVAQFESWFSYIPTYLIYWMNITAFSSLNASVPEHRNILNRRLLNRFGRNQMAFDLGIDPALFDDETAIAEKIRELDSQFDLVMITEMMDQSLILLKHELCWPNFDELASLRTNARTSQFKMELSAEVRDNLRRINRADQLIYDHFRRKFLKRIDEFGSEKMNREVEQLQKANDKLYDACIDDVVENGTLVQKFVLKRKVVNDEFCNSLIREDFTYTRHLFAEQKAFYKVSFENSFIFDALLRIAEFVLSRYFEKPRDTSLFITSLYNSLWTN